MQDPGSRKQYKIIQMAEMASDSVIMAILQGSLDHEDTFWGYGDFLNRLRQFFDQMGSEIPL